MRSRNFHDSGGSRENEANARFRAYLRAVDGPTSAAAHADTTESGGPYKPLCELGSPRTGTCRQSREESVSAGMLRMSRTRRRRNAHRPGSRFRSSPRSISRGFILGATQWKHQTWNAFIRTFSGPATMADCNLPEDTLIAYSTLVTSTLGIEPGFIGSNNPNEKIAVAEAIATYCFPSTA